MEVVSSKHRQFKPVVLVLPGQKDTDTQWPEKAAKPLAKADPELWKAFRRMSKPQRSDRNTQSNCDFVPPTVVYPDSKGMRCMCYENLMSILRENVCITPPPSFKVTNEKSKKSKGTLESITPAWSRRTIQGFRDNEQLQYPLSTLVIRWQLKRQLPMYNPNTLRYLLEPYGAIQDIRISTPNSCLIIFKEISTACRVSQSRCLGYPTNKLLCTWWHPSMANKSIAARAKGVTIKTNHFLL